MCLINVEIRKEREYLYVFNESIMNVYNINRKLRKCHKWTGISFVLIASLHGVFSSIELLSMNIGTLIVILSVLMGMVYYFRKKLDKSSSWLIIHRTLTIVILILIPIHIIEVEGFVGLNVLITELNGNQKIVELEIEKDIDNNVYNDGIYIGEAIGYCPGLVVSVSVKDNLIESIEIIEHNEDKESYFMPAFTSIPSQIIENQSLVVDTVSGSTYSSVGIVNAVADALSDALVSGEIIIEEIELNETRNNGKGKNRH